MPVADADSKNRATGGRNQLCILLAYPSVVGDSCGGYDQRSQSRSVRLDFAQLLGADHSQAGEAVGFPALAQFLQAWEFVRMSRDDDFTADIVGDAVLAAELDHGGGPGDAQPRLQGAGLVVHARVNHAAVVSALVAGDAVFFFDQEQAKMREAARDFERDAESNHTTTDDDYAVTRIGHCLEDCTVAEAASSRGPAWRATL